MKPNPYKRLLDSDVESDIRNGQVAYISGLWRRGEQRAPGGRERRREVRIPTDDPAEITTPSTRTQVRVLDVSRSGMRLHVPELLLPGTLLHVYLRDTEVLVEVRYCVAADGGFHAGVQVQTVV